MITMYTVVVKYPARLITRGGSEFPWTYLAHVKATGPLEALGRGCREAMLAQLNEDRGKLEDWVGLVVLNGHVNMEWQR